MKMKLLSISAGILLFMWLIIRQGQSHDEPGDKKPPSRSTQALMQDKLGYAHKVLEGIVIEDFDKITSNARLLGLVGRAASWHVIDSPQYDRYLKNFQECVAEIERQGKLKNLDSAALNYVQMTMTCVDCHKHVRAVRPTESKPNP